MPTRIVRWCGNSLIGLVLCMLLVGCGLANEVLTREQAQSAMARGETTAAKTKYQKLVERDPTNAQYQYGLGSTHLTAGELTEARIALEKAWRLAPNRRGFTAKVLDKLAETYYRQDATHRLRSFLKHTAEKAGTAQAYLRQARYLRKLGDVDAARTAHRKAAVYANENNPVPYLAMADFYREIGDQNNARKALRYAHHIAPNDRRVRQQLREYGVSPTQPASGEPAKPALLNE